MAVGSGTDLSELEHSWFSTHLTTKAPNARIEDIKRAYYIQVVGTANTSENITELEMRWLRTLTGVTAKDLDTMWREAVVGAGLTPQPSTLANKVLYFSNVA